ncbi:MAG: lytic polysaccharide monooxygenase [Bacilli bacterium]
MKRKMKSVVAATILLSSGLLLSSTVSSHGHMLKSRAGLCATGENKNCGLVIYEPYSVEAIGGFPQTGPADGVIASGGVSHFSELNEQSATRWSKVDVKTGANTFTWQLKVPHRTEDWRYYMTKPGWDPSKPLKRSDLQLISRIVDGGKMPENTVSHTISIPNDRSGYHIILGVWEISDTLNAFYQVMDVNVTNGNTTPDSIAPSVPENMLASSITTNSVDLKWTASTDNVGVASYEVLRDGKVVATTSSTSLTDKQLTPNTAYTYTVRALDTAGNKSSLSKSVSVTTLKAPTVDTTPPSIVTDVHSMGESTNSVDLMWSGATDNVGISGYMVYRDGVKVYSGSTTTAWKDTSLTPNTTYTYTVAAVDTSGNIGKQSAIFTVKTKAPVAGDTWVANKVYNTGDKVLYNNSEWKAKWWTQNETPGPADVWEKQLSSTDPSSKSWQSTVAYTSGNIVEYNGAQYQAKWWTKGDIPGKADVWKKI